MRTPSPTATARGFAPGAVQSAGVAESAPNFSTDQVWPSIDDQHASRPESTWQPITWLPSPVNVASAPSGAVNFVHVEPSGELHSVPGPLAVPLESVLSLIHISEPTRLGMISY